MYLTRESVSQGIFVDAEGNICEGANMNVAILTQQGELLVQSFLAVLQALLATCFYDTVHCA